MTVTALLKLLAQHDGSGSFAITVTGVAAPLKLGSPFRMLILRVPFVMGIATPLKPLEAKPQKHFCEF